MAREASMVLEVDPSAVGMAEAMAGAAWEAEAGWVVSRLLVR